jgi:hypothetical protein
VLPQQLRVGVNGYYLKQITDANDQRRRRRLTQSRVLGVGPGAVWHFSQDDHLFFNAYFETLGRNRPEGMRFLLRWTHHF